MMDERQKTAMMTERNMRGERHDLGRRMVLDAIAETPAVENRGRVGPFLVDMAVLSVVLRAGAVAVGVARKEGMCGDERGVSRKE
jgi:cytochrome c-type biogenesis protein CcmH/NrfG